MVLCEPRLTRRLFLRPASHRPLCGPLSPRKPCASSGPSLLQTYGFPGNIQSLPRPQQVRPARDEGQAVNFPTMPQYSFQHQHLKITAQPTPMQLNCINTTRTCRRVLKTGFFFFFLQMWLIPALRHNNNLQQRNLTCYARQSGCWTTECSPCHTAGIWSTLGLVLH